MGPLVVLSVLLENYWQDNVLGGYFINFQPIEQKLLNLKWFLSLEINQKSKNYFSINQCFFIILSLEFTFASSYHMMKCICLFMSWEMHEESPIDHLNQSMHLHVTWGNAFASMSWRNAWGVSHWPSYWPSSHLAISTNQCLFMWREKMHLFFHVMGKYIGNLPFNHFKQSMPFHVTGKYIKNISFSHFKQSMPFHVT
jgi:hypothetical protein